LAFIFFIILSFEGNLTSNKIRNDDESNLFLIERISIDCSDHQNDANNNKLFIFQSNYQVGINKLDIDNKSFCANKLTSSSFSIIWHHISSIPFTIESFHDIHDLRILYKSFLC
jgi:hypothetical protein